MAVRERMKRIRRKYDYFEVKEKATQGNGEKYSGSTGWKEKNGCMNKGFEKMWSEGKEGTGSERIALEETNAVKHRGKIRK